MRIIRNAQPSALTKADRIRLSRDIPTRRPFTLAAFLKLAALAVVLAALYSFIA